MPTRQAAAAAAALVGQLSQAVVSLKKFKDLSGMQQ